MKLQETKNSKSTAEYAKLLKEVGSKLRILIVEDDADANKILTSFAEKFFLRVDSAYNGEDALELYKTKRYDIILSDICMPNMDGIALANNIKQIDSTQPIIFLTAFNDANYLLGAIKVGVSSYISKPVDMSELLMVLYNIASQIEDKFLQDKFIQDILEDKAQYKTQVDELLLRIKTLETELSQLKLAQHRTPVITTTHCPNEKVAVFRDDSQNIKDTHSLLIEAKKITATDFLDSLITLPDSKVKEIEKHLEVIEVLFHKLENIKSDDTLMECDIANRFLECSKIIHQWFEFRDISFALEKLSHAILCASTRQDRLDLYTGNVLCTCLFAFSKNLNAWLNNIFIYKNAMDIHYMDDSFMCEATEIEKILTQENSKSNDMDFVLF